MCPPDHIRNFIYLILHQHNVPRLSLFCKNLVNIFFSKVTVGAAIYNDTVMSCTIYLDNSMAALSWKHLDLRNIHACILHKISEHSTIFSYRSCVYYACACSRRCHRLVQTLAAYIQLDAICQYGFSRKYKILHLIYLINIHRSK